jgi:hypothetical protein
MLRGDLARPRIPVLAHLVDVHVAAIFRISFVLAW